MSVQCTSSATHGLAATTAITAPPYAMGLYVKTTHAQARQFLTISGSNNADEVILGLDFRNANGQIVGYVSCSSPAKAIEYLNNTLTENVWTSIVGGYPTNFSRDLWVNGGNKVTDSTVIAPLALQKWILSGRPGDFINPIGGSAAHVWLAKNGLDDVEKQYIGLGGHVRATAVTNYYKCDRIASGALPDEIGTIPFPFVGTFTKGADDPDVATYWLGPDIGDQTWHQNSAIVAINVAAYFDTVSAPFTLRLMKISPTAQGATTTTAAGTATRIVSIASLTAAALVPGDYVTIGSSGYTRVLAVLTTSAPAAKLLLARPLTFASAATVTRFTASSASIAGVGFGNTISGTPTGTQAPTAGYFLRAVNNAQPANLSLSFDTNPFSIEVVAVPIAPVFSQLPGVTLAKSDGYTVGFLPNTACTVYGVALKAGSAQPSKASVKAGTGLAAAQKAVTGADALTFTGLDFPIHDLWFVASNVVGDSPLAGIPAAFKAPPAQRVYRTFTSIDAASLYAGNAAVADIEETPIALDSGAVVIYLPDGNEYYSMAGFQHRSARVYDVSAGAWLLDDAGQQFFNVWYNNHPPTFQAQPRLALKLNVAMAPYDLKALFPHADPDAVSVTSLEALPTGLSITNSLLTGTPTASVIHTYALRATDIAGATTDGSLLIIVGQVAVPQLFQLDYRDAVLLLAATYLQTQVNWVDDPGLPNIVIDQMPRAGTSVDVDSVVSLTVTRTPGGTLPIVGLRKHSFHCVPNAQGDLDLHTPKG